MRRTPRALTAGVVAGLLATGLAGCGDGETRAAPGPASSAATPTPTPTPTASPTPTPSPTPEPTRTYRLTTRPAGDPERVLVATEAGDSLVDASVEPERLDDEGVLAPPPGVVGWYAEPGWPKPGYAGASILAGHVNTRKNGPDTFARLPQVRPGATVTVVYDSGEAVRFVVTRSRAMSKRAVPRDDTIWDADAPRPLLRLITCDPTTPIKGGHYVGNWVVWASPVPV